MVSKWTCSYFYRETKTDKQGKGFSAKLWSIDLTGYNERLVNTPTDARPIMVIFIK